MAEALFISGMAVCVGTGIGVGVGHGVIVAIGVGIGVGVGQGVAVALGLGVAVGAGVIIALGLGVAVGVAIGLWRPAYAALYPLMVAFTSIPKVAVVPIMVIWFGIGFTTNMLTAFILCFFPLDIKTGEFQLFNLR